MESSEPATHLKLIADAWTRSKFIDKTCACVNEVRHPISGGCSAWYQTALG